ncbi:MAG TPA: hypothetical protein PKX48_05780 [Planctomycetota bacterium]|jgi:hypothetical protein|nr:hypothetical protein [Planctomycetota bacterium]OQC20200.1 MAG: hypothetical protein BWX69_01978 [Planctomycetes bacterium ADurb.Bin069]NMD35620.1 hypothetical protein [Planctomycetota bacterium]HNR99276.1 hypothetical protein [Planctomycetota bacterium]HNU27060.1 hypothetical protein [Planctomycetota bacterium]
MSATEVARTLSLDRTEEGASFLIYRHGRPACLMAPPVAGSRKISECLAILRGRPGVTLDDRFGRDLREVISGEGVEDRPWD